MRCEVVAIGTELLLGQIVDTNSAWMGEQLALRGIEHLRQTKVGDNQERMVSVLREALEPRRCCHRLRWPRSHPGRHHPGGDRRADGCAARAARRAGRLHPRSVRRAAAVPCRRTTCARPTCPSGATPIEQRTGTAPGLICPVGDKVIYAVPGVPYEMREMLERAVLPDLERRAGVAADLRQPHPANVGRERVPRSPSCSGRASTPSTSPATPRLPSSPAGSKASRSG